MNPIEPDMRSWLLPDCPPLPPRDREATRLVTEARAAAKDGGKQARIAAAKATRESFERMDEVRNGYLAAHPIPPVPGVWMVGVRVHDSDYEWHALRPLGSGWVEVWDGRADPQRYRVQKVRPFPMRRSMLRLRLEGGPTLIVRVTAEPESIATIGREFPRWWANFTGGGDDPIGGVLILLWFVAMIVIWPRFVPGARQRARVRDELVRALRS